MINHVAIAGQASAVEIAQERLGLGFPNAEGRKGGLLFFHLDLFLLRTSWLIPTFYQLALLLFRSLPPPLLLLLHAVD